MCDVNHEPHDVRTPPMANIEGHSEAALSSLIEGVWLRERRRRTGRPSVSRRLPPVAERLSNMNAPDLIFPGEVGDGAGNPKYAMIAAC